MSNQRETLQQQLSNSRAALLQCLQPLDEAQWQTVVFSEENQWTAADILRHLVEAQRGMTMQIAQIQAGGTGVPEEFDLARWNNRGVSKNQSKTPAELLAELEEGRVNLLMLLENISEADWEKKGRHGSGRILTITQIFQIIAEHEVTHSNDIKQALNLL